MVQEEVQLLLDMTGLIKDKKLADYTRDKLVNSPAYFKEIPASQSGKYHPKFALGEGGLVRHTIIGALMAYEFLEIAFFRLTQEEKDAIMSAILLHDTMKWGAKEDGSQGFQKAHPKLASERVVNEYPLVAGMIRSHMGQWGANKPGNVPQLVTHLADYVASRKFIDADFTEIIEYANNVIKRFKEAQA